MHDVLRQRILRKIESLPDEQAYQILDFIEFLESKYAQTPAVEASGLQKFAENLENKLRKKAVSPATIREAFQLISAADRVLSGVSSAGKQILSELGEALEGPPEGEARGAREVGGGGPSPTPSPQPRTSTPGSPGSPQAGDGGPEGEGGAQNR